jgi:hypothetical protein
MPSAFPRPTCLTWNRTQDLKREQQHNELGFVAWGGGSPRHNCQRSGFGGRKTCGTRAPSAAEQLVERVTVQPM